MNELHQMQGVLHPITEGYINVPYEGLVWAFPTDLDTPVRQIQDCYTDENHDVNYTY